MQQLPIAHSNVMELNTQPTNLLGQVQTEYTWRLCKTTLVWMAQRPTLVDSVWKIVSFIVIARFVTIEPAAAVDCNDCPQRKRDCADSGAGALNHSEELGGWNKLLDQDKT